MVINHNTKSTYTGDGATKTFTVTFDFQRPADVRVCIDDVQYMNFFVTGGAAILKDAPASGAAVELRRVIANVQENSPSLGLQRSPKIIEKSLDRLCMMLQDGAPGAYTIDVDASGPGTVSPSGDTDVPVGDDQTFTITPDSGAVAKVVADGVNLGSVSSYTFNKVISSHKLVITFTAPVAVADWIRSNQNFTFSSSPTNAPFNSFALSKDGTFVLMYNKATDAIDMYAVSTPGDITTIAQTPSSSSTISGSWDVEQMCLTNNNKILALCDDERLREYSFTNGLNLAGGLTLENDIEPDSYLLSGYTVSEAFSIDVSDENKVLILCEGDDGGGTTTDLFLLDIASSGDVTTLSNSIRRTVPNHSGGFPWIGAALLPSNRAVMLESRNASSNDLYAYDWNASGFASATEVIQAFDSLTEDTPGTTPPPANWASTYQGSVQYCSQSDTLWFSEVINTSLDEHRIFNLRNING